jgi:hypothetical protein
MKARATGGRQVEQPSIDAQERGKLFDHEPVVRHYPMADADTLLALPPEWPEAENG